MEQLLLRVGSQAASFAIRSGLGYASRFAFVQVSKFIQGVPDEVTPELEKMRRRLENKIRIVTPAIDLIERIAARGNSSLASTVQLTTALRHDINEFGKKVSEAADEQKEGASSKVEKHNITAVLDSMRDLLRRIEDAVPLISLALTTSGANLSSSLPDTVSPSRLLQASALLRTADDAFDATHNPIQVGPTFIVKYYSIFTAHARVSAIKDIQWKEEYAKCRACIVRVPSRAHRENLLEKGFLEGFEYELRIMEDLDDGRYHEELEGWSRAKMKAAVTQKGFIEGRSRHLSVHQIARLFYEHAGILLNLGESLSPVLIAKVQHGAPHPQNVLEKFANPGDESDEDFGPGLASSFDSDEEDLSGKGAWMGDTEWVAFEVFQEESDDEEEEEEDSEDSDANDLLQGMSALNLDAAPVVPLRTPRADQPSSLSLLEYLLRLAALQTFEQQSHMHLPDEHIVLFLRDDNPASRTQSATIDGERTMRRQSSQTSVSSDFNTRVAATHHLPISSTQSEDNHQTSTPLGGAVVSSSPIPSSPVNRNPRSHLERAMAADHDPMTLVTPLSNRRITRHQYHKNPLRKKSPTFPGKGGTSAAAGSSPAASGAVVINSKPSSAPNSLQRRFPAPKIGKSSEDNLNDKNNSPAAAAAENDRNGLGSPLAGKQGSLPQRRVVSLRQNKRKG